MKERKWLQYFRQKNLFCVLNRTFCKVLGGKYNQNYTLFFLLNYVRLLNGHKKSRLHHYYSCRQSAFEKCETDV
jgi:hypothetical protein